MNNEGINEMNKVMNEQNLKEWKMHGNNEFNGTHKINGGNINYE